jgi:hypothetical protein
VEVFAARHGLDLEKLQLPLLPVRPKLLKIVLSGSGTYLPARFLDLYQKFILTNISPPPEVATLNENLRAPALRDLPKTRRWHALYDYGRKAYSYDELQFNISTGLGNLGWDQSRPQPQYHTQTNPRRCLRTSKSRHIP